MRGVGLISVYVTNQYSTDKITCSLKVGIFAVVIIYNDGVDFIALFGNLTALLRRVVSINQSYAEKC